MLGTAPRAGCLVGDLDVPDALAGLLLALPTVVRVPRLGMGAVEEPLSSRGLAGGSACAVGDRGRGAGLAEIRRASFGGNVRRVSGSGGG